MEMPSKPDLETLVGRIIREQRTGEYGKLTAIDEQRENMIGRIADSLIENPPGPDYINDDTWTLTEGTLREEIVRRVRSEIDSIIPFHN